MSHFDAFICDTCGDVWGVEKRTRVTMKFEQTEFCNLGQYWRDLCPKCIIAPFDWNPTATRKKKTRGDNEVAAAEQDESGASA